MSKKFDVSFWHVPENGKLKTDEEVDVIVARAGEVYYMTYHPDTGLVRSPNGTVPPEFLREFDWYAVPDDLIKREVED